MFRGLRFHIWEYEDRVWGAETNVFEAGRSQDIEGAYEDDYFQTRSFHGRICCLECKYLSCEDHEVSQQAGCL